MKTLTFDITQFEHKSKRKPDPVFEQKKLLIPEFLELINQNVGKGYKPLTEMRFKIKMNDAGYTDIKSWFPLLAEMKQSKNPGATWGYKMKVK